jgi:hypothetical protein
MLLRRNLVCREGAVLQSLMEFTSPVRRTNRAQWIAQWSCTPLFSTVSQGKVINGTFQD